MTGQEMERAIEFLLESQAQIASRQDRTDAQIAETSRQLQAYAETQSEFIQIVTQTMTKLAESQAHTDQRLSALIDVVNEGRGNGNGSRS